VEEKDYIERRIEPAILGECRRKT